MDITPARALTPIFKVVRAGVKVSYRVGKVGLEFTTIVRKYGDDVAEVVSATGKIAGSKEIITATKTALRTDALKVTSDIVGDLGDDAISVAGKNTSKYPHANKTIVGKQSKDGSRGWRIDYDSEKGAHYNWWNHNTGEKGAVLFEGTEDQVGFLKQQMTNSK